MIPNRMPNPMPMIPNKRPQMLTFDEPRFLSIQSKAAALEPAIRRVVEEAVAAGARSLFLLGTGGAAILMQPAARYLSRCIAFPVFAETSAELVLSGHPYLGEDSLVVIPSLSGTTKESVEALRHCKARGARVISLVGHAGTPLASEADQCLVNFAEDDTSSESFYIQSFLIALSLERALGDGSAHEDFVRDLPRLPDALLDAKRTVEPKAEALAAHIAGSPWHIITGAGGTWPEANYYGMCILEEMQWIRTRPVHASDFFHGTLELIEEGVSVILFKGEDETRPLVERVESFARQHTDKVAVVDARDYGLPGLSPRTRALMSPAVIATVMERVSAHLEVMTAHPLTTRRYYKRVPY
jgi:fructoselysine-6-phosphate deglycase